MGYVGDDHGVWVVSGVESKTGMHSLECVERFVWDVAEETKEAKNLFTCSSF